MRDVSGRDVLKVAVPVALVLAAGLALAWRFVEPLPPRSIRMAAGAPDGAYAESARRYREILARDGVQIEIVTTAGSMENLRLLRAPRDGVEEGFVQGGTEAAAGRAQVPDLRSLASVFLEPLWIFVRADQRVDRLSELRGRRLAVGVEGSGTRVLATALLAASGIRESADLSPIGGREAVDALLAGTVDAAFFVTARPSPALDLLLRSPRVRLVNMRQAEAYARRYPFLSRVSLPEGALDLSAPIPAERTEMLAPAAALASRPTLHPAIIDLLLSAAVEVHRAGRLFEQPGQFPSQNYVDFPLSDEARRYFRSGPSFFRQHLPFWAAVIAERGLIILLPLLTLTIPLMRLAPAAYRWQVRRRIYCWYRDLRALELRALAAASPAEHERVNEGLRQLERRVSAIKTPLGYAHELFWLREHIRLVARRLGPEDLPASREGDPPGDRPRSVAREA
jgi:TRAP transporter TAXI family solute receptor